MRSEEWSWSDARKKSSHWKPSVYINSSRLWAKLEYCGWLTGSGCWCSWPRASWSAKETVWSRRTFLPAKGPKRQVFPRDTQFVHGSGRLHRSLRALQKAHEYWLLRCGRVSLNASMATDVTFYGGYCKGIRGYSVGYMFKALSLFLPPPLSLAEYPRGPGLTLLMQLKT